MSIHSAAEQVDDTARFAPGEPPAAIAASFACRLCLRAADLVVIAGAPGARVARSHCSGCGSLERIALSEEQASALWRLPRSRPFIHFAPSLW